MKLNDSTPTATEVTLFVHAADTLDIIRDTFYLQHVEGDIVTPNERVYTVYTVKPLNGAGPEHGPTPE